MVWPVGGRGLMVPPQPLITTETCEMPSLSVPTQLVGTTAVVNVKPPPLLAVVTIVPSHEICAYRAAWPPDTLTTPSETVAFLTVSASAALLLSTSSSAAPVVIRMNDSVPVPMFELLALRCDERRRCRYWRHRNPWGEDDTLPGPRAVFPVLDSRSRATTEPE